MDVCPKCNVILLGNCFKFRRQSISVTSLSGEVQPVASKVADEHCSPKTLHTKLNQHHDSFSDDPKFEEKFLE